MNGNRLREQTGLAGKILVGVVAWALGAVLLLTATLVNAQQIDTRVDRITHTVTPIDHNLESVKLAADTNRIAGEILAAAKPLSGQADQIIQATASIDGTARSIDSTVGQIGTTVQAIDGNARSINGTVLDINKTAKDINGTAKTIGGTVNGISGNVTAIGSSVNGISAELAAVLDTARSIRGDHAAPANGLGDGISGINRRADFVTGLVSAIKGDTANILASVKNIEASARSIDTKLP
jgi:methyl-accepting chemotaxis protein